MFYGQYKILLEFKKPISHLWKELIHLIENPRYEIYSIESSKEYSIDDYKCISYIVTAKKNITEETIYKPFIPILKDLKYKKNPNAPEYHNNPFHEEFYDVGIVVSVLM